MAHEAVNHKKIAILIFILATKYILDPQGMQISSYGRLYLCYGQINWYGELHGVGLRIRKGEGIYEG